MWELEWDVEELDPGLFYSCVRTRFEAPVDVNVPKVGETVRDDGWRRVGSKVGELRYEFARNYVNVSSHREPQ